MRLPAPHELWTAAALLALCLLACERSGDHRGAGSGPPGTGAPAIDASRPVEPAPCELTRASRSLVTLNLESADGRCVIALPANPRPGRYAVRVAIAGRDDSASVQLPAAEEGFLYANEGLVEIEAADETGVSGRFEVTDSNPPNTGGPFQGRFSVVF